MSGRYPGTWRVRHVSLPGVDDLIPAQLEELRADLEALREELAATVEASRSGSAIVDLDQPIGRVSRVDALQQQSMAKAARQRHEQRLKQVEAALRRIAAGEYGECLRCDDPIAWRRLKARPETPLCLECQAEVERTR
ncbi:MAG: TraR/DksA family transcriptional regulator [Myxococcota bacterium]